LHYTVIPSSPAAGGESLTVCAYRSTQTRRLCPEMKYHCDAQMRILRLQTPRQRLQKSVAAIACLIALLLVYAPMATATLMAVTGACCTGDYCPIHGNHHPSQKSDAQQNENAPMDCGHEGHATSKMNSCSVSCCQTVEQIAVKVHVFLLTPLPITTSLATLCPAPIALNGSLVSPVFAPKAPPPKHLAN